MHLLDGEEKVKATEDILSLQKFIDQAGKSLSIEPIPIMEDRILWNPGSHIGGCRDFTCVLVNPPTDTGKKPKYEQTLFFEVGVFYNNIYYTGRLYYKEGLIQKGELSHSVIGRQIRTMSEQDVEFVKNYPPHRLYFFERASIRLKLKMIDERLTLWKLEVNEMGDDGNYTTKQIDISP